MMMVSTAQPTPAVQAPPAPPEAAQMDWFIGEWDMRSRRMSSENPAQWIEESARSSVSSVLGGHALLETFDSTFGTTLYRALSVRTYNAATKQWEQRYKDNSTDGFIEYTGEFKDGEYTGYSNRSYVDEAAGGRGRDNGIREVFYNIEPDRFLWRLERTSDHGHTWEVIWTLMYTRRVG